MPTFSYLVYPVKGAGQILKEHLSDLPYCEAIQSENADVIVLVTDTPDEHEEKLLKQRLQEIKSLQSLHMAFGHVDT